MKRAIKLSMSIIALFLVICLSACDAESATDVVARSLNIDVSNAEEISYTDSHGGFHNDGTTYIALKFEDDTMAEQLKENDKWSSFPLDDTVQTLVYGKEDETSKTGPFLSDGAGNPLVPEIQNGFYLLIDHQSDKTDILERASFNFTVGLYDADNNILYCCKLDT